MYFRLIRIRHNGERIEDKDNGFKELEEVKAVLDRYVPGVYSAYMIFDKAGNMIASKGLFGAD